MASLLYLLCALCWTFRPCSSVSSPEWFQNITTNLFSLPGDVTLGGLFPINQQSNSNGLISEPNSIKCESLNEYGLGLSLVMKYAVDEINGKQDLLPGIKLGYKMYDTCRHSSNVVKPTISFLTEKTTNALSVECNYTDYETSISAVIGPYTSEMVSVIGKLLGFFLMPQISYGATSDKFSDNLLYPSFFRTVPSDKWQVDAMVQLMSEFNWTWVAVIGSEEEYGQSGVQQFSKVAENKSVCVAYQGLIPVYTDPGPAVRTIINNIRTTEVKVVIVFALPESAAFFFEQVIQENLTGVWIASSSWIIHNRLISIPKIKDIGTIMGFVDKLDSLDLLNNYAEALLRKISEEREKNATIQPKSHDPDNPCPQCWYLSAANITLVNDLAVKRLGFAVYSAVYSVAQALHTLLECDSAGCNWGPDSKIYPWKLLEVLRNTSVNINGTILEFDENGNPNVGYKLLEWTWETSGKVAFKNVGNYYQNKLFINASRFEWHTENSTVPLSTCSAQCADGQVRRVKGFHSCCYDCIDCLAGTFQENKDDIQCAKCPERQWSNDRSTNCTPPIFEILKWDSTDALKIILAVLALLICQVSVAVVFLIHRGTPLVKASGGVLTFLVLLSLMGGCLSLFLFLGEPDDVVCRLQLPLITIFQTIALSIILSISLQIFLVTEFPKKVAPHLRTLQGPGSWLFVLICCSVQAGLCGWFVQKEPSLTAYKNNMEINFMKTFLPCPVSPDKLAVMQGLNAAMALVSFMSTFMAIKPHHQYNLARDITFSTLIYCVIWVIFIPVYTGLTANILTVSKNKSTVHVYFTLAGNLGLVVAYYFPKCYLLFKNPDSNTPEYFCTFLEGVPPTPPQEEPQPPPAK
ncbi:taste receptor type 1 member 3 [Poecilia latipinna]|uniref:Taste receptor type 1 member 3 n=1 Tax=Poecilia latipinna TaxID=48699 RepID=A0A3B3U927_9TELE|nr:PREDICTED: taste receptor type 1 member 3-like [Poecilia latipinna]